MEYLISGNFTEVVLLASKFVSFPCQLNNTTFDQWEYFLCARSEISEKAKHSSHNIDHCFDSRNEFF